MKKIIITIYALCQTFAFAGVSKVSHRIEANLNGAVQFGKDIENKAFQKYTYLGAVYAPEWSLELNDKIGLSFAPRVGLGVETNISKLNNGTQGTSASATSLSAEQQTGTSKKTAQQIEDLYGLKGSLGGELDIDFKIPDSETVYLGFDTNVTGLGYVGKSATTNGDKKGGIAYDLGLSVGGKIGEKVKIGGRVGYELETLWEVGKGGTPELNHNMVLGLRFGYIVGQ